MFDDPKPDDIVCSPKSKRTCTVREFNAMSKEERQEFDKPLEEGQDTIAECRRGSCTQFMTTAVS